MLVQKIILLSLFLCSLGFAQSVDPRDIEESIAKKKGLPGSVYLIYSAGLGYSQGTLKNSKGDTRTYGLDVIGTAGLSYESDKRYMALELGVEAIWGISGFLVAPLHLQAGPYAKLTLAGFYVQGSYKFTGVNQGLAEMMFHICTSPGQQDCNELEGTRSYLHKFPTIEFGKDIAQEYNMGVQLNLRPGRDGKYWGVRFRKVLN